MCGSIQAQVLCHIAVCLPQIQREKGRECVWGRGGEGEGDRDNLCERARERESERARERESKRARERENKRASERESTRASERGGEGEREREREISHVIHIHVTSTNESCHSVSLPAKYILRGREKGREGEKGR